MSRLNFNGLALTGVPRLLLSLYYLKAASPELAGIARFVQMTFKPTITRAARNRSALNLGTKPGWPGEARVSWNKLRSRQTE